MIFTCPADFYGDDKYISERDVMKSDRANF